MIPSAKIAICCSAPPANTLMMPTMFAVAAPAVALRRISTSTPGTGIQAPIRYATIMASVNSSLRRRSGMRTAVTKALSMALSVGSAGGIGRLR
jgi:hypothetical protein